MIAPVFLFALLAGAHSNPVEEVSASCAVAINHVVEYLKKDTESEGSAGFFSGFLSEYSTIRCVKSRKDPARIFVVLGRMEKLKLFHNDAFLVDSQFHVSKVRDIPCDEHPVEGICG